MAVQGNYSWIDVNGVPASNNVWLEDGDAASAFALTIKKLSNAKLKNVSYSTPIDISGLNNNVAAAANVETARAKMAITLSAPPLGQGLPRQTVTIQIPAPVGTYINGLTGDTQNADIQALVGVVLTQAGTPTDAVDRVAYVK